MSSSIHSILKETRVFKPSPEFSQHAHISSLEQYEQLNREAEEDPEKFWGRIAADLHWFRKWDKVLEWEAPWAKWFVGGQINLSYNCLDHHVATWRRNKARPRDCGQQFIEHPLRACRKREPHLLKGRSSAARAP